MSESSLDKPWASKGSLMVRKMCWLEQKRVGFALALDWLEGSVNLVHMGWIVRDC